MTDKVDARSIEEHLRIRSEREALDVCLGQTRDPGVAIFCRSLQVNDFPLLILHGAELIGAI
jgi:hypothetical protein